MGDIYWVFIKLQSLLKKNGIKHADIYTWEIQEHKFNRSKPYIERVPFVRYGGSKVISTQNNSCFNDIYFGNVWKKENFQEFDYVLSMNGILRNGYDLDSHKLDEYESNWYFSLTQSDEEDAARIEYKKLGDYIVAYFADDGMYSSTWLKHLPINKIHYILSRLYRDTGCKIILTGGKWDKSFSTRLANLCQDIDIIDMTGQTSMNQLFALIQESKGMIGWAGGNTIKSVYFKVPTVIIWSQYFKNEGFYYNSVPPDSINKWHEIAVVEKDSPDEILKRMKRAMEWQ